jgi:hypothetical protein
MRKFPEEVRANTMPDLVCPGEARALALRLHGC